MTLVVSHRMESLVDELFMRLFKNFLPFQQTWVVLDSLVNKQWLMLELLKRSPSQGIAGIQFLNWREAVDRLCQPACSVLELEIQLAEILLKNQHDPDFQTIAAFLQKNGPNGFNEAVHSLSRQIKEAGFFGFKSPPASEWQKKMLEQLAWRFPSNGETHPADVGIHCFCVNEMPQIGWDSISDRSSIYLFSPCRMFWEDAVSDRERGKMTRRLRQKNMNAASLNAWEGYLKETHPLLANWGKLGQETLKYLDSRSLEVVELYEEKFNGSLLHRLQQDVLWLRTFSDAVPEMEDDSSVQIIAAGVSPLKEVEILRRQIMRLSTTPLSEILVLAPDIRPYEPFIRFVFGSDFPINISPVFQLPKMAFLQGWILFFDIAKRGWEADALVELFENASFQKKHGIVSEDLKWFSLWLKEAKVRKNLTEGSSSWTEGLKKMVLGLAAIANSSYPDRVQSIDWGCADRLDLLIHLIELLQKHIQEFQHPQRTVEEWCLLWKNAADELFEAENGDDSVFQKFLKELVSVSCNTPLPFSLLEHIFREKCQQETTAERSLSIDAIQFSSLQPGSLRPAKAIFILGMNDENFPHRKTPTSWELDIQKANAVDSDRYLFLEALFSAREQFTISFCNISAEDGRTIEPSSVVSDLKHLIDAHYLKKKWEVQQGSSKKLPAIQARTFWPRLSEIKDGTSTHVYRLSDLSLLSRNPWKFLLEKKLGIYLKEESLFSEKRLEDFALPGYVEQHLFKLSLQSSLDEVIASHPHLFLPGSFGEWSKVRLKKKTKEWSKYLKKWEISPKDFVSVRLAHEKKSVPGIVELPPVALTMDSGEKVEIIGEIEMVVPSGLVSLQDFSIHGLLRQWPAMLVLMKADPTKKSLFSLQKGRVKSFEMDPSEALKRWMEYAFRAERSFSPLIGPWASDFLQKSREDWMRQASKTAANEEDRTIRWVLARNEQLPLHQIWEEWNPFVKEVFPELAGEENDAAL